MSDGNVSQTRVVAKQVAEEVVTLFYSEHPELKRTEAEIPAPLKWLGGGAMALVMVMFVGVSGWLVTSVDAMQDTLARMDERQIASTETHDSRFGELDRRVTALEARSGK